MKFLAAYVMQGRMQASLVASAFALLSLIVPPLGIVSSGSVALVTLRRGASEGLYILGCACIAATLLGGMVINSYQLPFWYSLTLWTPVWLIAVILREGRHLLLAIESIVLIASLAIVAAYWYQPDLATVWENLLSELLENLIVKANPQLPIAVVREKLSVLYHFVITGLVAQVYVIGILAGLFLGRWWQAMLYNPGGFKKEYLALQSGPVLAIASLSIIAVAWLASGLIAEICANISIVLFVLYSLIGTIVLHVVFSNMKMSQMTVPFLYITLLFVPHVLIPVAIIGLTDTWLNLRNKFSNNRA